MNWSRGNQETYLTITLPAALTASESGIVSDWELRYFLRPGLARHSPPSLLSIECFIIHCSGHSANTFSHAISWSQEIGNGAPTGLRSFLLLLLCEIIVRWNKYNIILKILISCQIRIRCSWNWRSLRVQVHSKISDEIMICQSHGYNYRGFL